MNVEQIRDYCLSLPLTTEDMPFDDQHVVFRLKGKIFLCLPTHRGDVVAMKCDPECAQELREAHYEIEGAFHWNKKYWNDVHLDGHLSDRLVQDLVRHAYNEVNKKLPKKDRVAMQPDGISEE